MCDQINIFHKKNLHAAVNPGEPLLSILNMLAPIYRFHW